MRIRTTQIKMTTRQKSTTSHGTIKQEQSTRHTLHCHARGACATQTYVYHRSRTYTKSLHEDRHGNRRTCFTNIKVNIYNIQTANCQLLEFLLQRTDDNEAQCYTIALTNYRKSVSTSHSGANWATLQNGNGLQQHIVPKQLHCDNNQICKHICNSEHQWKQHSPLNIWSPCNLCRTTTSCAFSTNKAEGRKRVHKQYNLPRTSTVHKNTIHADPNTRGTSNNVSRCAYSNIKSTTPKTLALQHTNAIVYHWLCGI